MKKLLLKFFGVLAVMSMFSYSAYAEEQSDGYIVKISSNAVVLFSAVGDEITPLGDEYYKAKSIEAAYDVFSEEDIETIFPDYQLELFESEYPYVTSDERITEQWNLDLIHADKAREKGIFGKGVKIGILDSGLALPHDDFKQANIMQGYNCMANASDTANVLDTFGHGTNVGGVIAAQIDNQTDIAGIAAEADIVPIQITDGKNILLSDIFSGIKKAIELDCDVINMSFGGDFTNQEAINAFKSCIDEAEKAGIIMVAAVGNGGTALNYPAAYDNVIGVSSVDKNKVISRYSQNNNSVFVAAPGEAILTLSKDGTLERSTGTSLATPHVTAAVALMKELNPDISLNEIKEILKTTSEDLGDEGYDIYYGYGMLNIQGIIEKMNKYIPNVVISQGMKNGASRIHIHNNAEKNITADGYFAKYRNKNLSALETIQNVELNPGVTNFFFKDEYNSFMLWDSCLIPYSEKYTIKKIDTNVEESD